MCGGVSGEDHRCDRRGEHSHPDSPLRQLHLLRPVRGLLHDHQGDRSLRQVRPGGVRPRAGRHHGREGARALRTLWRGNHDARPPQVDRQEDGFARRGQPDASGRAAQGPGCHGRSGAARRQGRRQGGLISHDVPGLQARGLPDRGLDGLGCVRRIAGSRDGIAGEQGFNGTGPRGPVLHCATRGA